MNAFDTKSANSKRAGMKLLRAKLYCSSIQSFYYSLLQRSKGAIISSGVKEEDLETSIKKDGDTHKAIIGWTASVINDAGGNGAKYSKHLSDMKRKRNRFSYSSEMASEKTAKRIRDSHKIISNYIERKD